MSRHRDDPGGAWILAGCGVALLLMAALGAPLRFDLLEEGLEVGYLLRSRRYPWDQLEALRLEQAQLSP